MTVGDTHREPAWWQRLWRLVRYRLLVPLQRGYRTPEFTARGAAVGLVVAMTPTVGVQMPICLLIWALVRWLKPSWNFSVILAMAWTWVTNLVTVPPIYFTFLVTGRVILGRSDGVTGYAAFQNELAGLLTHEAGPLESLWIYVAGIFEIWGLPMFVGCLPWAALCGYVGYRWSLSFLRRLKAARERRFARKQERKRRTDGTSQAASA